MPDPNIEHQRLVMRLGFVFCEVVNPPAGGEVFPGLNLSDRTDDWKSNYRCPDVAVFWRATRPRFSRHIFAEQPTSWLRSLARATRAAISWSFMPSLGVRELLIIDRHPWSLELYRLSGSDLVLAGGSSASKATLSPARSFLSAFSFFPPNRGRKFALRKMGEVRSRSA